MGASVVQRFGFSLVAPPPPVLTRACPHTATPFFRTFRFLFRNHGFFFVPIVRELIHWCFEDVLRCCARQPNAANQEWLYPPFSLVHGTTDLYPRLHGTHFVPRLPQTFLMLTMKDRSHPHSI